MKECPLIGIYHKTREGAVLVVVATMSFAAVQLNVNLVTRFEVKNDTIAGIIVILVSILRYCARPNLENTKNHFVSSFCPSGSLLEQSDEVF